MNVIFNIKSEKNNGNKRREQIGDSTANTLCQAASNYSDSDWKRNNITECIEFIQIAPNKKPCDNQVKPGTDNFHTGAKLKNKNTAIKTINADHMKVKFHKKSGNISNRSGTNENTTVNEPCKDADDGSSSDWERNSDSEDDSDIGDNEEDNALDPSEDDNKIKGNQKPNKNISGFNYLKCLYSNVDSLTNKLEKFKLRVQEIKPDVISIVETDIQIDPSNTKYYFPDECLAINGYSMYRKDNGNEVRGGILVYVADKINVTTDSELNNISADCKESLWLVLEVKKQKVLFGSVYRKGNSKALNNTILRNQVKYVFK